MGKSLILGVGDVGVELSKELEEAVGVSRSGSEEFEGELIKANVNKEIPVDLSEFETVYHLATRNSGEEDCAWNLPEVQASRNLVDWLKKIQNGPELVYASSFSAINAGPEGSVLSYSEAKKVGETICREYDRTRIVRLGNVYGDEKGVVDSIIQTARDEGKITVHGDGSQKRPFISIKDATRSLKKSKRRTVNAHEEVYTIKAVAEKVTEVFNAEINLRKEVETSNVEPPASNFQTKNSLGEYIEDKKE